MYYSSNNASQQTPAAPAQRRIPTPQETAYYLYLMRNSGLYEQLSPQAPPQTPVQPQFPRPQNGPYGR